MKKIKTLVFSCLICMSIFSCKNNLSSSLFNIDGLDSNINQIKKRGYKRVSGVDVDIFSKKKKDTLIDLQIKINESTIYSKTWKIKMKSNDFEYIENFFFSKRVNFITPISKYNEQEYYFTVLDSNNNTFVCKFLKEKGSFYLYIIYYKPI